MAEAHTGTNAEQVQAKYKSVGRKPGKARPHNPQKPCQYEGCEKWAWAQGYCDNHYQKLKRQGVIKSIRKVNDPVGRFHSSYAVNPETGCWDWTGWIHPEKGYGLLPIGGAGKKIRAHRFSWELHFGPIPEGLFVLHKCDREKCCRPEHLFLGDNEDNMRDMVAKGRQAKDLGKIKITPAMAMNMRVMYARGEHSMLRLAKIYNVDHSTVSGIIKGRSHLAP